MSDNALRVRAALRQERQQKQQLGLHTSQQAYQQWQESREQLVHPEASVYYHHATK